MTAVHVAGTGGSRSLFVALGLVFLAAVTRLLLQVLAMPPYAGLDEAFHVARVSFVRTAGRNPGPRELSLPEYVLRSLQLEPGAPWDFATAGSRWPGAVATRTVPWPNTPIPTGAAARYVAPNYESQHPSLYYRVAALALDRMSLARTQLGELMALRILAVLFAVTAVVAGSLLGWKAVGIPGLVAGAAVCCAPAWLALVARSANDGLCVAAVSLAICLGFSGSAGRILVAVEALAWAVAVGTKATAWPLLALVPLVSRRFGWSAARFAATGLAALGSLLLTWRDLVSRTGTFLGDQGGRLEAPSATSSAHAAIDVWRMVKVFLSSAVWPGAQHGNALTLAGMGLFIGPVLLAFLAAAFIRGPKPPHRLLVLVCIVAFAGAQAVHAWGFLRAAQTAGVAEPRGGFEGWYFWTTSALIVPLCLGWVLTRLRRRAVAVWALFGWLLAWDIGIHEGALFRDYAGATSPETPSTVFRWGAGTVSTRVPTGDRLAILSASGASTGLLRSLRAAHVAAIVGLLAVGFPLFPLRRRQRITEAPGQEQEPGAATEGIVEGLREAEGLRPRAYRPSSPHSFSFR